MRINQVIAHTAPKTHEGGDAARHQTPIQELRRATMACLLWEDGFYESGESIADRISSLIPKCNPAEVATLAIGLRTQGKLRHVPLLLCRELARDSSRFAVAATLAECIQRPDEITEFLAIYAKDSTDKTKPLRKLPSQVKRGLAKAFTKFNEYSLAKYNRDGAVKLRDALFLCHAKPLDEAQADLWKRLVDGKLVTPDTWEVALSAGADKKETFERLITEGKLGSLALLRNLRNMESAGLDKAFVGAVLLKDAVHTKALPFRYLAAARAIPIWEDIIDAAMQVALTNVDKLPGATLLMVDVSGSMDAKLSAKSDLTRLDAACALAVLLRGIAGDIAVTTFSNELKAVPSRQGMALVDAIQGSQGHAGTYLSRSLTQLHQSPNCHYDRIIVITDEQSADGLRYAPLPGAKGYMINVATDKHGVGYGPWVSINGFSESVVSYIQAVEGLMTKVTAEGVVLPAV